MLSLVLVSSPALQMAPLATVPAARTAAPLMQGMMAPYDAPSNAEFHRNRRRSYRNWGRNGRRNWGNGYGGADSNWYPMGNFGTGSINSYGHDRCALDQRARTANHPASSVADFSCSLPRSRWWADGQVRQRLDRRLPARSHGVPGLRRPGL